MEDGHEFLAVALTRDEDTSGDFELRLLRAAEKELAADATILVSDELDGPIVGFDRYSRVFFLNRVAWSACSKAGMSLRAVRTVPRTEIPIEASLLIGRRSDFPTRE